MTDGPIVLCGLGRIGRGVLDYLKGIREAADGLERASQVLADALRRVERGAA